MLPKSASGINAEVPLSFRWTIFREIVPTRRYLPSFRSLVISFVLWDNIAAVDFFPINRWTVGGVAMARSDLLISLVRASVSGDRQGIEKTTEAIIAEERGKQHNVLADQLDLALRANGTNGKATVVPDLSASRARDFLVEINPQRRIEELVLTETCQKGCEQLIEEQHRADLLRANGMEPRHRVLLVGPPGNGKTTLAEAVAEALAVPFFVVRYEGMIGSFLGETASRLKRVFDYARTVPCVLFFDEFDALGKERGDIHETGEIKRVVTSLLMQVDALPSYTVVMAATNHSELLDRAVWRRFQLRLELPSPTRAQLEHYFQSFASKLRDPSGFTPSQIVRTLGKISFAEAEEFCNDIKRRQILAYDRLDSKDMVAEQLAMWANRVGKKDDHSARVSAPSTSEA